MSRAPFSFFLSLGIFASSAFPANNAVASSRLKGNHNATTLSSSVLDVRALRGLMQNVFPWSIIATRPDEEAKCSSRDAHSTRRDFVISCAS